jgi:undecaprenyl pyrophosphate synthase
MKILVISQEDSRLPIVDLARTLGDMIKQESLFADDVSTNLVDEHLTGLQY